MAWRLSFAAGSTRLAASYIAKLDQPSVSKERRRKGDTPKHTHMRASMCANKNVQRLLPLTYFNGSITDLNQRAPQVGFTRHGSHRGGPGLVQLGRQLRGFGSEGVHFSIGSGLQRGAQVVREG